MRRLVSWLDDIDGWFTARDERRVDPVAVVVAAAVGGVVLGAVAAIALR